MREFGPVEALRLLSFDAIQMSVCTDPNLYQLMLETRVQTKAALGAMPPHVALVAYLIGVQDLTQDECATQLGLSQPTVSRQWEEAQNWVAEFV